MTVAVLNDDDDITHRWLMNEPVKLFNDRRISIACKWRRVGLCIFGVGKMIIFLYLKSYNIQVWRG